MHSPCCARRKLIDGCGTGAVAAPSAPSALVTAEACSSSKEVEVDLGMSSSESAAAAAAALARAGSVLGVFGAAKIQSFGRKVVWNSCTHDATTLIAADRVDLGGVRGITAATRPPTQ